MINPNQSEVPLSKLFPLSVYSLNKIAKISFIVIIVSFAFLSQLSGAIVEGSLATIGDNQAPLNASPSQITINLTNQSSLIANSPIAQTAKPYKKVVTVTAYSSTPDQTDDTPFITASNTLVHDGVIAANFLAFGTKIKIPQLFGDKIFTVEDRMHHRYQNNHIDIWFPTRESALEFGVKTVEIEILP
jgi:3D (Asp-Asp-Asp) domain-containing protein